MRIVQPERGDLRSTMIPEPALARRLISVPAGLFVEKSPAAPPLVLRIRVSLRSCSNHSAALAARLPYREGIAPFQRAPDRSEQGRQRECADAADSAEHE